MVENDLIKKLPAFMLTSVAVITSTYFYRRNRQKKQRHTIENERLAVGIVGAGAIGTVTGLSLLSSSSNNNNNNNNNKHEHQQSHTTTVVLVGRKFLTAASKASNGVLCLRDKAGDGEIRTFRVEDRLIVTEDMNDLLGCSVIIVAVKISATKSVGDQLADTLPLDANVTIVSFQNGMRNAQILRAALKEYHNVQVVSSMVNFNADWEFSSNIFNKNTDGGLTIEQPLRTSADGDNHERRIEMLASALTNGKLPSYVVTDIQRTMYSKLLINLFNGINALAGISTPSTLVQMGYRRVWAAAITEGLAVYEENGIVPASFRGLPPYLIPKILLLPDILFWFVIRRVVKLDDGSKSSMLQDLERGRDTTEVNDLCGEIVRLGVDTTATTPVNTALVRLVKLSEGCKGSPCMPADELLVQVGLESRKL